MTRDQVIDDARREGVTIDELSYRGPGRTEGNTDRELANALDALITMGVHDQASGDVESPTGHFARYDRWIVLTDTQGFVTVNEHANQDYAKSHYLALENAYADWAREDDE